MIYSKSDEFLIALGKIFDSARLNLKITGLKIDNNNIITWINFEKKSLKEHLLRIFRVQQLLL
ncbi:MAG: hypothetical protein ACRD8K_03620 [Nitrososphaeraceae archaeon]